MTSKRGSWYANYFNVFVRLIVILVLTGIALGIYSSLLSDVMKNDQRVWALLILWIFSAYIVLPRLTRWLTKIYVPNYFIGRTRTNDGLLGDPINLALNGTEAQLIESMHKAGWSQADPLNLISSIKITCATLLRQNYKHAPVSSLYVFGRKQDVAFEKEFGNNPRKRHHVRFWKTPDNWWLPGGYQTDWLGAATFDKNVGLSLFTGQITHKIDANVDTEREFVIQSLRNAKTTDSVHVVEHFTTSYYSRNGGGDIIHTDGSLPFITLQ